MQSFTSYTELGPQVGHSHNLLDACNSVGNTNDIFHTVLDRFLMVSAFNFPSAQL